MKKEVRFLHVNLQNKHGTAVDEENDTSGVEENLEGEGMAAKKIRKKKGDKEERNGKEERGRM